MVWTFACALTWMFAHPQEVIVGGGELGGWFYVSGGTIVKCRRLELKITGFGVQ